MINKKLERLGVAGVAASLSGNRDVTIGERKIEFNPSTGGVGIKSLGKIDYLVKVGGYTATAVIPERKAKSKK